MLTDLSIAWGLRRVSLPASPAGVGRVSFIFQKYMYSVPFLINLGFASVFFNTISVLVMAKRALAMKGKQRYTARWLVGYQKRTFGDGVEPNPDMVNEQNRWSECYNRDVAAGHFGLQFHHETWASIALALPRFVLGVATIGIVQIANNESVSARVDP